MFGIKDPDPKPAVPPINEFIPFTGSIYPNQYPLTSFDSIADNSNINVLPADAPLLLSLFDIEGVEANIPASEMLLFTPLGLRLLTSQADAALYNLGEGAEDDWADLKVMITYCTHSIWYCAYARMESEKLLKDTKNRTRKVEYLDIPGQAHAVSDPTCT